MTARGQARNAYPAMRIFMFGQEVTEDAFSCTVNWADDTRAPSTAQITISNNHDRYALTKNDIFALHPNDLKPTTVKLPDVRTKLVNDPALETFRLAFEAAQTQKEQLAFLQQSTGASLEDARKILEAGQSVLTKFTEEEYLPAINLGEDNIQTQIKERISGIADPVKRRVILAKFNRTQQVEQPDLHETGEKSLLDNRRGKRLKGQAARYPFFAGRPIFHSNDPVRIFWRDPFNARAWYYMFSGFITDWTRSTTTNNVKTITFTCEDVLRIFRYARLTTNPGIFDIRALKQAEDFSVRTFFQDDFTNLTLTEILYTLIFGPEIPGTTENLRDQGNLTPAAVNRVKGADDLEYERFAANGGKSVQRIPQFGVGAFNFERSITFVFGKSTTSPQSRDNDPPVPEKLKRREVRLTGANALGVYQSVVDHQVQVSDLETMSLPGKSIPRSALPRDARTGEPSIDAVITAIGEHPHLYPIDGGRLILLAPASLGPNTGRALLEKDFKGVEGQTTFKNRLFVILNLLQRIEFSFYASPKGDILVEMPLYDFDPTDFGVEQLSWSRVSEATSSSDSSTSGARARVLENAAKNIAGPYDMHYRVALNDTMDSNQTFTDDKIRTQVRCAGINVQNLRSTGTAVDIGLPPEVVTLRALVPQFGLRMEQADPPAFIATPDAAAIYAQLKINQWNAEALTSQVDTIPQLRLGPNRPIEVEEGPYIATVRSVSRVLNWEGRDMNQSIGMNYTRVWDGLVEADGETPIYTAIGGAASRPLDYGVLLQSKKDAASTKERGTVDASSLEVPGTAGVVT